MSETLAIYPGSFDPVTNGHLDLIGRGCRMFDSVIVAVLINIEKEPLFTVDERVEMLKQATRTIQKASVETFSGLLVDYAAKKKATAILRGIRAFSDYEYEFQMTLMNRKLSPNIETVFLMPAESYTYLSSRLVREVFRLGGSVKDLVPPVVEEHLKRRLKAKRG